MKCPVCKSEFDPKLTTAMPFCSDRCRSIDLGRWLGEAYSMPHVPDPEADERPEGEQSADGKSEHQNGVG